MEKETSSRSSEYDSDSDSEECTHSSFREKAGNMVCIECGLELNNHEINYDKEWRYYGENDAQHSKNPTRCHYRNIDDRSIFKDTEIKHFPQSVVEIANGMYKKIAIEKIYRGSSRKSIVFACIFNAYKEIGFPKKPEQIAVHFKLKKKAISKGMKLFSSVIKVDNTYIKPIDFVPDILQKLNAPFKTADDVKKIYEKVENRSSLLNRSNPQSFSCGLVYYYCKSIGKGISRKEFSKKVGLSDITIIRLAKEINKLLETNVKL